MLYPVAGSKWSKIRTLFCFRAQTGYLLEVPGTADIQEMAKKSPCLGNTHCCAQCLRANNLRFLTLPSLPVVGKSQLDKSFSSLPLVK